MWRRFVAGKRCLFVGGTHKLLTALKSCFGWSESGHIRSFADIEALNEGVTSKFGESVDIVVVCLSKKMNDSITLDTSARNPDDGGLTSVVQGTIAATTSSNAFQDAREPYVIYFLEHAEHRPETLVKAIESGADAYITYESTTSASACDLGLKLIYGERGFSLRHQLEASAVIKAQSLTAFQTRVMHCLRDDYLTDRQISQRVGASERMVGKTIAQLFEIFDCHRRSALAKQSIYL